MTPARFVLIVTVIVLVLFGVSLAVQDKTRDRTNPTNSWVSKFSERFEERQKINVATDLKSDCRNGSQLFIPKLQPTCVVFVLTNETRRVRKAELALSGLDAFMLRYEPSAEDREAVKLQIDRFDPRQQINLVFLEHGGILTLTRKGVQADAVITIK